MKRSPIIFILLLAAMLLAACQTGSPAAPAATSTPEVTPTGSGPVVGPTATRPQSDLNSPVASVLAQLAIARKLVISTDEIKFVSSEQVDWKDSCLEAGGPADSCAKVTTPGFKFIFEVKGTQYEVRTNGNGSVIKILDNAEGPKSGPTDTATPAAAVNAQKMLAQQLGVTVDQVSLDTVEAVDWPNGCLGVQMPGKMCTQVITPGYRVVMSSGGKQYEFHTDQAGGAILSAVPSLPQTADKVLVWEQTEGSICSHVEIGSQGVAYGPCGGTLAQTQLNRADELAYLFATYATFNSTTKAGTVQFNGQGTTQPTPAEMRSVAEWAKLVFMEAQGGRSGAAWGAAMAWHREGGIAGFCNDLVVYLNGWAWPSSCKSGQAKEFNHYRLTADELDQMYRWVDQFKSTDIEQKDNATADSMKITLSLYGQGQADPAQGDKDQMLAYMGKLYGEAAQ